MKFRMWICIGLFLSMLGSVSYADTITAATEISDPATSIVVAKTKPQFSITLASNRTTGYSWHLVNYHQRLITLVNHVYQAPQNAPLGAGGREIWTFKVNEAGFTAPQVSKIALLYAKPWDLKDNSKQVEFTVVTR